LQRTCALLDFLNNSEDFTACLVTGSEPPLKTHALREYIRKDMPGEADLILRDMRDSTAEEINRLRETAPVAVLDDRGPGREKADLVIDILPHPAHRINPAGYYPQCFIYGYEFTESVRLLEDLNIPKEIALTLYAGFSPEKSHINKLLKMVPPEMPAVLLTGSEPLLIKNGVIEGKTGKSYAEIIASSRVVLSHFGITLYEGFLTGARLLALNPSEYHNELTRCAAGLDIVSGGLLEQADPATIHGLIRNMAANPLCESVNAKSIYNRILHNLAAFKSVLKSSVQKQS
jgi:hypothetical protein